MEPDDVEQLVRRLYAVFEAKDRPAMEALLSEDFRFSSPRDDRISKAEYFQRCWPNADQLSGFELEKVLCEGDEAFVMYTARRKSDGVRFRNVELIHVHAGKVTQVEVYFGRDLSE